MSIAIRCRARIRAVIGAEPAATDRGVTLTEMLVGMAVMTVFMAIFLTAVVMMTGTANKVEATTISATQTNQAFLRLDKVVRYASAVSTPGVSATSGDWYVELTSPAATTGAANDTCTQLRIDAKQLQQRTWTVTGGTGSIPSGWTTIAGNFTNGSAANGSADAPFTSSPITAGTASTSFQRLQVRLVATAGNSAAATNRAEMTFTALNSDVSLASNATTCQQWGRS
jgi:prepilin-type N-terminal cleavage/methylation domain-containing protein